ncbi:esterase/lipase family protein, partial [Micromonospora harpali]
EKSGLFLPGGMFDLVLRPYETVTKQVVWDTEGFAWYKGQARSDRAVTAKLLVAGGVVHDNRTEPLLVRPKPVVLVHGFIKDAQTWGDHASLLASLHPLLKGFAVGDGQAPGKLSLGDPANPYEPTLNYGENARQLSLYVKGVLEKTGASRVDLLTHSLGGPVALLMLHNYDVENPLDGKPSVNRLLQMGAPILGTPCADLVMDLVHDEQRRNPDAKMPYWPALLYMSEEFAPEFHDEVTGPSEVKVSTLVGWKHKVKCPRLDREKGEFVDTEIDGDGFVPWQSAHAGYYDSLYTTTTHGEMTRSAEDIRTYVKPRLASRLTDSDNPSGELPPKPEEEGKQATGPGRDSAEPGRGVTAAGAGAD